MVIKKEKLIRRKPKCSKKLVGAFVERWNLSMKLSVIVPVYNVEKYLGKCVKSIIDQTFEDFELILVDDGSTDGSGDLCNELAKADKHIQVIHKANGGLSSARNSGLSRASGEYVSFIDSDDFIDVDMYAIMIEALERTKKDIAACGRVIDLWGEREKIEFALDGELEYSREEAIEEILLLRNLDVSACDKVYRRCLFDKIKYPEGKISEDAAIIFELLGYTNGVVHVGKPFYHYIYRKSSISKSKYNHCYYDAYMNCIRTENYISTNYPNMDKTCKIYCTQVCGSLLQCMAEDKTIIDEYKSDFYDYKKLFNKGYWSLITTRGMSLKLKVKLTFVYFNLYGLFLWLQRQR